MPTVHMQTEQVRDVARQITLSAQQMDNLVLHLLNQVRGIPWVSPTRDDYVAQFTILCNRLQAKIDEAELLALRLNREVDEWEQVASSFGLQGVGGAAGFLAGSGNHHQYKPDKKPENMRLLAELVMNGSDPIRSYKIGPNEYLMVIQGTSLDPNDSNNWGSAITTGLGLPSDFQKQVKLALLDLPAGAIVHMAGHSQGGIVAQNLAIEKDVTSHVTVKSVTTFGSPYTVPEGDATYYRYAAQGDIVPYLEGRDAFAIMLLLPFTGYNAVVTGYNAVAVALADRYPQTTIAGDFSDGLLGPHSVYSKSPELEKISADDMPFKITAWDGVPTVHDPGTPNSGLSVIYKNIALDATTIQQAADSASAKIVEGVQGKANAIGNAAQEAVGTAGNTVKRVSNFFGKMF